MVKNILSKLLSIFIIAIFLIACTQSINAIDIVNTTINSTFNGVRFIKTNPDNENIYSLVGHLLYEETKHPIVNMGGITTLIKHSNGTTVFSEKCTVTDNDGYFNMFDDFDVKKYGADNYTVTVKFVGFQGIDYFISPCNYSFVW
jgi:hypothetical protein